MTNKKNSLEASNNSDYTSEEDVTNEQPPKKLNQKEEKAIRAIICEQARTAKALKKERLEKEKNERIEAEIQKRLEERMKGVKTVKTPSPSPQKTRKLVVIEESSSSSEDEKPMRQLPSGTPQEKKKVTPQQKPTYSPYLYL